MLRRLAMPLLRASLREFPAATLVGPRQCGKTTLAKALGGTYFDLEVESDRLRLDLEWPHVVSGAGRGVKSRLILDEAQAHPAIFPRLRSAIDADRRRKGRFVLLGSV